MSRPADAASADWAAVTASVRGASHDRSGLPNQDAVRTLAVGGTTSGLVGAVADGHGGARYVRSDTGSAIAVEVACEAGSAFVDEVGDSPDTKALQKSLRSLAVTIVERWRERIASHYGQHGFTDEEAARGGGDLVRDPFISYGCTLVMALMGPSWVGLLQIGDGDALLVDADGLVTSPVPADDRLVGGETTSLCLPDAAGDARFAVLRAPLPELVVLASDGYCNSFEGERWREESGAGFLAAVRQDGLQKVGVKLPGWLADSAHAGGDDVTMMLAHRRGSGRSDALRSASAKASAGAGPPNRGRVVAGAAASALLVGIAAGGAGTWVLKPDTTRPPTSSGTTTVTSTTTTTTPPSDPTGGAVAQDVSILLNGKVVTFLPVAEDGRPMARVTLEDSGLLFAKPETKVDATKAEGFQGAELKDGSLYFTVAGGKPVKVDLGNRVGAVTRVRDFLWVLSDDGTQLRPVSIKDRKPEIVWQTVAQMSSN